MSLVYVKVYCNIMNKGRICYYLPLFRKFRLSNLKVQTKIQLGISWYHYFHGKYCHSYPSVLLTTPLCWSLDRYLVFNFSASGPQPFAGGSTVLRLSSVSWHASGVWVLSKSSKKCPELCSLVKYFIHFKVVWKGFNTRPQRSRARRLKEKIGP